MKLGVQLGLGAAWHAVTESGGGEEGSGEVSPPSGLSVTPMDGEALVEWTGAGGMTYAVWRGISSAFEDAELIADEIVDDYFLDEGLSNGTQYYWWVVASDGENHSSPVGPESGMPMAVVYGCTDPAANNWNPSATADDGSCTYDPVPGPPTLNSVAITSNGDLAAPKPGDLLTANVSASGFPTPTLLYEWQREIGGAISGATSNTYTVTADDIAGSRIRLKVVAQNTYAPDDERNSDYTGTVVTAPIIIVGVSSIGGTACDVPAGVQDGDMLIAVDVDSYGFLVNLPSGWSRLLSDAAWAGLSGYGSMAAWKIWHTDDPTTGITFGAGGSSNCAMIALRGPASPVAVGSWEEKTGTNMAFSGVSGTGTLLLLLTDRDNTVSLGVPSGMTSELEAGGATFRIAIFSLAANDAAGKTVTSNPNNYPCVGVGVIV